GIHLTLLNVPVTNFTAILHYQSNGDPRDPHSFPTRRSSDLVEFFYLRPRDIALYVGEGTLDVGITGRDLLLDSGAQADEVRGLRSEEHTSELQSRENLVCRLLLEKKKAINAAFKAGVTG